MNLENLFFLSNAWAQQEGAPASQGSALGMFMPWVIIFVIFYLLIFRPQQKQQKIRKQMLTDLKRGDEVITNGGIYGKITELKDNYLMLQVANNVTIKFDRSQINTINQPPQEKTS